MDQTKISKSDIERQIRDVRKALKKIRPSMPYNDSALQDLLCRVGVLEQALKFNRAFDKNPKAKLPKNRLCKCYEGDQS